MVAQVGQDRWMEEQTRQSCGYSQRKWLAKNCSQDEVDSYVASRNVD